VNFAYAPYLGTGVYQVADRRVYVMRVPISFWIRRPEDDRWGYRFLLPVTIGLHDFHPLDFLGEEFPSLQLSTLTILPGLEWRKKLYDRWVVRPFGHVGFGKDTKGGEITWVYDIGLKSRVIFPWKKWEFSIGNQLLAAGAKPTGGEKSSFFMLFDIGFDARHLFRTTEKRTHYWSVFTVYHFYFDPVEFENAFEETARVTNTVEFGVSYGVDPRKKFLGFRLPGIGVSYEVGPQFWAVRLNMGFKF
jgi:hypothetical protein